MPHLRTDDGPRKLRAVWLGPKGGTLPFEWTYIQWCVTLVAVPAVAGVVAALSALLGAPGWLVVLGMLYGAAAGVYLAVKIMRNVTFDEPVRHKTMTARGELSRKRHQPADTGVEWVWARPSITDLTPSSSSAPRGVRA